MKPSPELPHESLERIFHEPARLAIMSQVCASPKGCSFSDLQHTCSLTGGNLNRHLKVLTESGAVRIKKTFVDDKPRTSVHITANGLDRFSEYLASLSDVLTNAKQALPKTQRSRASLLGKVATA